MNATYVLLASLLCAAASPSADPADFVRAFYGDAQTNSKARGKWFTPKLAKLLASNERNAGKAKEVCGFLDFDAFTGSQEEVGAPKIGAATLAGEEARVEVGFTEQSARAVIVVLRKSGETWRIANIVYPKWANEKEHDLLGLLAQVLHEKCT